MSNGRAHSRNSNREMALVPAAVGVACRDIACIDFQQHTAHSTRHSAHTALKASEETGTAVTAVAAQHAPYYAISHANVEHNRSTGP